MQINTFVKKLIWRDYITLIFLTAAFIAASLTLFQPTIGTSFQVGLLVALVVLFGLPHGALDAELARKLGYLTGISSSLFFFSGYVAFALLGMLLWLFMPLVGLVLFLLISIYHFADDWRDCLPVWLRLATSTMIIAMPTVIYADTVSTIFHWLLLSQTASQALVQFLTILGLAATVVTLYGLFSQKFPFLLYLELLSLGLVATFLPPLIFFMVYFCFLHSARHLTDSAIQLGYSAWQCYLRSLPVLMATLLLGYGGYHLFHTGSVEQDLLRLIFIGLFALTLPHICLITIWYRSAAYSRG